MAARINNKHGMANEADQSFFCIFIYIFAFGPRALGRHNDRMHASKEIAERKWSDGRLPREDRATKRIATETIP